MLYEVCCLTGLFHWKFLLFHIIFLKFFIYLQRFNFIIGKNWLRWAKLLGPRVEALLQNWFLLCLCLNMCQKAQVQATLRSKKLSALVPVLHILICACMILVCLISYFLTYSVHKNILNCTCMFTKWMNKLSKL